MHYIVQKPFCFAGDSYKPGDTFEPEKYPFVCDSAKLARLVSTRRVVEDFKICGKDKKHPLPKDAEEAVAANTETSSQDSVSAEESKSPKRSKGGE